MASSRTRLRRAHIVTLVLVLAVLPLAGLAWATWQLLDEGGVLEQQQRRGRQVRLDRAADRIVAALGSSISESERALSAGEESWAPGALAVRFRDRNIVVTPPGRLAFVPIPESLSSASPDARTAALLPRGQKLSASGHHDAALQVLAQIRQAPPFFIENTPSWVAARYKRARILEQDGRVADLREEAAELARDLRALAPYLTGDVYKTYADDVERWQGNPLPSEPVALSLAVDAVWHRWSAKGFAAGASGRDPEADGTVVLWQASRAVLRALIATPAFIDTEWTSRAMDVAREHNVSFTVADPRATSSTALVTRTALQSGLPWAVTVSDASDAADTAFRQRRAVIIGSFLTLVTVVAAAGYVAIRAIGRELAVARQQSDFVAAVSHEFRTPLTSLGQFVELLREQSGLDESRRQECYDAQARSVDRLSRLVESLLDFGKLEAGTHEYRFAPQDCAALAQSVVADFNEHAVNAGYRIELVAARSATVNVDADAVARALWNLLDNAMKYSPGCKTIEVGVRAVQGSACIDVRDRGIGIGPQESRDIFRRFHRGAEARSRGIRGTGLGLAMVTEIMQAHGGRVDLDSQPGQGSTFTLVFPVAA